jgi:hypothetical protein
MSEYGFPTVPDMETAQLYVESVRSHYRDRHAEYSGKRTEEQQIIAMVIADEAQLLIDGVASATMALASTGRTTEAPEESSEPITGGYSWDQFRGEFARAMVGFAVITNRLDRDQFGVKGYADLAIDERVKVASILLADFLAHNAYRFGVDGVGIPESIVSKRHTEDGEVERTVTVVDKDIARSEREIEQNMRNRGYASASAAHAAVKISPSDYRALRIEYSEMDKDRFDYAVSFCRNVFEFLEQQE